MSFPQQKSELEILNNDFNKEKTNQWAILENSYALKMNKTRIVVREDPFKSKYDCDVCDGKGHLGFTCSICKGTKRYTPEGCNYEVDCISCLPGSGKDANVVLKPLGYILCAACRGLGGTISIPDESKTNTTTGNVLAIGENVHEYSIGDKIMFTNYTGTKFKILGHDLRIMVEDDVLCKVKLLKKNVDGIVEQGFAELENTGTPRE